MCSVFGDYDKNILLKLFVTANAYRNYLQLLTPCIQLAAMKDVYSSEMQKREDAYALRIEQAVGTVRDVAVAHVQQETDVVKAVAASEMKQEIVSAQETLSQEYAAKTGERVRMVQELRAKLAALDHHLSVIA
jgi:hypothetical protein